MSVTTKVRSPPVLQNWQSIATVLTKKRLNLAVSYWLCAPGLGFPQLELKGRASGFLVKAKQSESNKDFKPKYHLLTVSHGVAPWKWPQYDPSGLFSKLSPKNMTYTAELCNPDGSLICTAGLANKAYVHDVNDLAVLHFEDEEKYLPVFEKYGLHTGLKLAEYEEGYGLAKETPLEFHGHRTARLAKPNQINFTDADDGRIDLKPERIRGVMMDEHDEHHIFARTETVIQPGMCGSPAVFVTKGRGTAEEDFVYDEHSELVVAGMAHANIVQESQNEKLRGAASMVEALVIRKFLKQIEDGTVDPLVGGDVWAEIRKQKKQRFF